MEIKFKKKFKDTKISKRMLNASVKLYKRYSTITLEEIEKKWKRFVKYEDDESAMIEVKQKLTGFGDCDTCMLCKAVTDLPDGYMCLPSCNKCFWKLFTSGECQYQENRDTYEAIREAMTPKDTLEGYHARAKHMKAIMKKAFTEETLNELLK